MSQPLGKGYRVQRIILLRQFNNGVKNQAVVTAVEIFFTDSTLSVSVSASVSG